MIDVRKTFAKPKDVGKTYVLLVNAPHFSKRPSDLKLNGTQERQRHHFLAQFSIPFHMVWFVLLRVVAQKTTL